MAVSLAINAILALRIKDESDQQARLRVQVANLQAEVDALRKLPAASGTTILEQIAAAVVQIRELEFRKKVSPELLTDDKLRETVAAQFRKDNPRAEIDGDDAVLTALGLLKPNEDLWEILLGIQTEQVAGYYDTVTKKLIVGGNAKNPTPIDRVLLAHEYVHALTDQHFDLTRLDRLDDAGKDDEALAYLSLVEGDATNMMGVYAQRFLTPSEQREFIAAGQEAPTTKLDSAPEFIRRSLIFPYDEGTRFVRSLMEQEGLDAVDRAYTDPPTSTEQILHTSRYTRRDAPTAVTMPDVARTLGSGWSALPGGGVGEFDVQLVVDQFLSRSDAERAGSGWDGGGYAAAESSAGTVVAILTAWDSESEAREATETLGRWLPVRYGNKGGDMRLQGATGRGWQSPTGAGAALRSGNRMLLILAPDRATVERTRSGFAGF